MKPERRSLHLLSITQAKAKMFEYDVPQEHHIPISRDPSRLFTLAIGLLGDLAARINSNSVDQAEVRNLEEDLFFSARFFDAYFQANLDKEISPYLWLLGSASYYLSSLPGSSLLLAKKINIRELNLDGGGLEKLLLWILLSEYDQLFPRMETSFGELIQIVQRGYQQFFQDGSDEDNLSKSVQDLRSFAYSIGTPRQLLFADVLCAITIKKLENSTWISLPKYSGLSINLWRDILRKPKFSIKELWPAQHILGQNGLFQGMSAIVQMPTSAGKTKAIEIIIRSAFLSNRTSLAIVVAPFRALCHEIKDGFLQAFKNDPIFVNELSDVLQTDYLASRFLGRDQVIVVTPEKLSYVLRHSPELSEHIGLIIYDEGHQFDNGTRGITYELLLTSLKEKLPADAQSILISAVISNGDQIGRWLNGEGSVNITGSGLTPTYRSIGFASWTESLGRLYYVDPKNIDELEFFVPRIIEQFQLARRRRERIIRFFPERTQGKEIALYLGLKVARNGSVAIFCGTKSAVASLCQRAVEIFSRELPMRQPYYYSNRVEAEKIIFLHDANLGNDSPTTQSARLGIFSHHNNIPHGLRLSIEYALKEGMINFVICTSTLAQGVNLPLRYLIVTSTYQGEEQIKVRDFQNLIGRTGRAKFHTEGSILFSDPDVYDNHVRNSDYWRWLKVRTLLNPSESEPCVSTLLSVFSPLEVEEEGASIFLTSDEIIRLYPRGRQAVIEYIDDIADRSGLEIAIREKLIKQVTWKLHIISSIESFLMAHNDDSKSELDEQKVAELARGTLAYSIADEKQRVQIEELFKLLAMNIASYLPEPEKRVIFGRTLIGLYNSIDLFNWLSTNIDELIESQNEFELLDSLWPILTKNILNTVFKKCDKPDLLKTIAVDWLRGRPYSQLFEIILSSGAKIIAGSTTRSFRLEHVVEICDNGVAYEGALFVGAFCDYLQLIPKNGVDQLLLRLQNLQKQMKYGLSSPIAIILYELGFSDRVICSVLSPIFEDVTLDRDSILAALRTRRDQVFDVLNPYPSYFFEVYRNLMQ
jgi:POLQ-like helicase